MNYVGGFSNLLNPYALLTGITTVAVCTLYGAIFLTLKIKGDLVQSARLFASKFWILTVILLIAVLMATYFFTDILGQLVINSGIIPLAGFAAVLLAGYFIRKQKDGLAFTMTALTIALVLTTFFLILFPRVMVSSLNPEYSLTVYNASSTQYTLTIMTVVALLFVPVVLLYQGWSYWIFRRRISIDSHLEY